jgi:hypothetical protein
MSLSTYVCQLLGPSVKQFIRDKLLVFKQDAKLYLSNPNALVRSIFNPGARNTPHMRKSERDK